MSPKSKIESDANERNFLDLKLLEKIRTGDRKAFESIFFFYYSKLHNFTLQYIKNSSIAEDIVQDIFVYLWEHRERLEIKDSLSSYLYRAVRNRSLNHLKRMRVEITVEEEVMVLFEDTERKADEKFDHLELSDAVEKAIEKLPGRCRLIFTMNRKDGLKYSEIARILGISLNTVTTQMAIALKKLRSLLSSYNNI